MSTRKTTMKNDKDLYRNLSEVMEKLYLKNTVTFFHNYKEVCYKRSIHSRAKNIHIKFNFKQIFFILIPIKV